MDITLIISLSIFLTFLFWMFAFAFYSDNWEEYMSKDKVARITLLLIFWPIGVPIFILKIPVFLVRSVKTLFIEAFLKDGNE